MNLKQYSITHPVMNKYDRGPSAVCLNVKSCVRSISKPWCFNDDLCPANKKTNRTT